MRLIFLMILPLLASGCLNAESAAICDATKRLRDAHADSLLVDGGDMSVSTGAALIATLDAGCSDQ